jgi:hypothetical protein
MKIIKLVARKETICATGYHSLVFNTIFIYFFETGKEKVKVKQSRYRPGLAQRVPES